MKTHSYTKKFYQGQFDIVYQSAKIIIRLLLELIHPRRVIDVGCGIGIWLSAFREYGIEDIWGVDVEDFDRDILLIPKDRFIGCDVEKPFSIPMEFDLVISLEVAEHLPGSCAETFIDSLTRLGPVVLFSAAIPFQGGEQHLNEQWPDYWARFFQQKGYLLIDSMREKIWDNEDVAWWYAQNILLFARREYVERNILLKEGVQKNGLSGLSIVHPTLYATLAYPKMKLIGRLVSTFPIEMKNNFMRTTRRLLLRGAIRSSN